MADADLLTLSQWFSPAFPVGGFAYSHGAEVTISSGAIRDANSLFDWLSAILTDGSGRTDAILLCAALKKDADDIALDAHARALAASRERWAETREQGAAFTATHNALSGKENVPVALPVAVGRAAQELALPPERVAALYLQAVVSNLVSAAVRFVPLGQTDGQSVLQRLQPLIVRISAEAAAANVDDITSSVPGAELAAMLHETLPVRIFKS